MCELCGHLGLVDEVCLDCSVVRIVPCPERCQTALEILPFLSEEDQVWRPYSAGHSAEGEPHQNTTFRKLELVYIPDPDRTIVDYFASM